MSRSNKLFTSLLLGAAGGAAAAIFLASKTGKAVKNKVSDFVRDYKEDPEAMHSDWADKATNLKHHASETYSDVKHKFETGEFSADSLVNTVKEKAAELKERVSQETTFATDPESEANTTAEEGDENLLIEETNINPQSEDITLDINDLKEK